MEARDLVLTAAPVVLPIVGVAGGWIMWVTNSIKKYDAVIARMDELVTLLLQDRLSQK